MSKAGTPRVLATALAALLLLPAHAQAQDDVTERTPNVRDVAMTPLSDLNIRRDPIPENLERARAAPYSRENVTSCADILREVGDLDAVLGDDFDTAPPDHRGITVTGVAQSVVGMFIPFRGVLREISGANSHEFSFREAIAAGLMRRAYLKGIGQEMDCPYPASPATPELLARWQASAEARENNDDLIGISDDGTAFVSQPVVQKTK